MLLNLSAYVYGACFACALCMILCLGVVLVGRLCEVMDLKGVYVCVCVLLFVVFVLALVF